ncbi:MAG: hypothetical protein AAF688_10705 [Bacteroidota bacterium]
MREETFFKIYLPALEEALLKDYINYGYNVAGPDWYIKDEKTRREIYLFEENNFENFKDLFESVALYFDALSHNFEEIKGTDIHQFKIKLFGIIENYKQKYNISS